MPSDAFTVAILEHRYTKEFASLLERAGLAVYPCPLLEEKPVENREELQAFIREAAAGRLDMMIFLTGVGVRFLIGEADAMGLREDFVKALSRLTIVARGPKPAAALHQTGLRVDVAPANPTTEGVIEALRGRDLQGKRAGIQLYGAPNPQLASALQSQGAVVTAVQVYAYGAASDSGAVSALIGRIFDGRVQAVAFTSGPQVRMLFDFALQLGLADRLQQALKSVVAVASIGDVTSRALAERGLAPQIVALQPRMASLAHALAEYARSRS